MAAPEPYVYEPVDDTVGGHPRWLVALVVGAVLAPVFGLTPILQYMGWFLASLVHEIGHVVAAWLFGSPAYPAIRLDGHAAAIHKEQSVVLALLMWGAIAYGAWYFRKRRGLAVTLGVIALLYPALAFTQARELLHLLAGHLGELAFAGVFLVRGMSGGFSHSLAEQVVSATVGWYLLGRNLVLSWGLMTSDAARAAYAGNGSFGLTNDYIRVANNVLGCSLQTVAMLMFAIALLVLPIAVFAWLKIERSDLFTGGVAFSD